MPDPNAVAAAAEASIRQYIASILAAPQVSHPNPYAHLPQEDRPVIVASSPSPPPVVASGFGTPQTHVLGGVPQQGMGGAPIALGQIISGFAHANPQLISHASLALPGGAFNLPSGGLSLPVAAKRFRNLAKRAGSNPAKARAAFLRSLSS